MKKKKEVVRKKEFTAWAVVDDVLSKHHGAGMIFNPVLHQFSLAIFTHPDFAESYMKMFKGKIKMKVVPIRFKHTLPAKKK
jgi:hypothetical protein